MCTCNDLRRRAHRAAVRIHDHLLRPHQLDQAIRLPQQRWEELQKVARHLQLALSYRAALHASQLQQLQLLL